MLPGDRYAIEDTRTFAQKPEQSCLPWINLSTSRPLCTSDYSLLALRTFPNVTNYKKTTKNSPPNSSHNACLSEPSRLPFKHVWKSCC